MNNPIVQGLIFAAAVVIPGGLIVYWAWKYQEAKKARNLKKEKGPNAPFFDRTQN